ncbi:MAG TPA: M12 family metallo-peptidase, partial [Pyrinomonadaceae bacterium]|nr:M12 family metallo-peptidase [Pyrinomonadaceae bacterium]
MKTIRTMLLTLTTLLAFMIIFLPTVENKEEPAIVTMRNEEASASSPLGFSQTSSAVGRLIVGRPQDPELSRMFRQYDLLILNGAAGARQIRSSGRVSLSTSWGVFDLELAPNDLRAPDYTAQSIGSDGVVRRLSETEITTFKGSVSRFQGGQARFTVTEDSLEGLIIVEGERFFVQPARLLSKQAQADEFVFYRGSDVRLESGECGVTLAAQIEAERERNLNPAAWLSSKATNSVAVPPLTTLKVIRIATDADAEYVAALGGVAAANSQIMNIMNQVDGIYQVELGLTFQLVLQNSWTDAATDPYSSTVASDLLTQFRTYWGSNSTNVQRSLAHLWTGKDLDGATIGIAYISVTCSSAAFSYGISQRFPITELNPITIQTVTLTAHELGHAFSARHTNQATTTVPREVEVACMDTIMESGIGDGGSFCPYSRLQVTGFANANQTCLTDTSAPTPVVSPCAAIPVMTNGSPRNGSLASSDCQSPSRGVSFYADRYWFDALAGQNVLIVLNKSITGLDPYLYLIGPSGYVVSQDDDSNSNQNSRLEFKLPHSGRYVIEATSFGVKQTGDYTLLTTV